MVHDESLAAAVTRARRRGVLRVYLGAAPGVGKTYAMLSEGRRRAERGTDVVVAVVEAHGRSPIEALLTGLDVLASPDSAGDGLDVEAVISRRPAVALVDELAHTNPPGSTTSSRWQDVERILDAGIDVITTVNIQNIESLNDVVAEITGVVQSETVPDDVVRRADQIELVDMSPQALRRRLAHGNVYAPEQVDAAVTDYFRVGNLTALRELALLWTAERVDDALARYRAEHGISQPWPARERVVVALAGGPEGETLVRRAARVAQGASGGELLALHVSRGERLVGAGPDTLARQRRLVESLGGSWHTIVDEDVAGAVLGFARDMNASHIVIGSSRRGRVRTVLAPGPGAGIVRGAGGIDVHLVTHEPGAGRRTPPPRRTVLSRRRRQTGWALALLGPGLVSGLLRAFPGAPDLATVLPVFLALTVGVALTGGMWPALVTALSCGVLANYLFTHPLHTFEIAETANGVAIVVLIAVAVAVSIVVDVAARRTTEAARARAEADTLTALAGAVLRGEDAVPAMLGGLREALSLDRVELVERDRGPRPNEASAAPVAVPIGNDATLVLHGRPVGVSGLRVAQAVAAQLQTVRERDRLRVQASGVQAERERTAMRTALLAAVSHDLRTPLAGIKAAISSLRATDVRLDPADADELLAEVERSSDRLQGLIDNLLDMSRLDAGAVIPQIVPVALDEIAPVALHGLPAERFTLDIPDTLPLVLADPGLLERALANVLENAARHAAPGPPIGLSAAATPDGIVVRIADRGPGVPDTQLGVMFKPFQRLGDAPSGHGVGLGLAVARGFVEACGGRIEAEPTPGGGLTILIMLPIAQEFA